MGTWGVGPFDNDEAMDLVADLLETPTTTQSHAITVTRNLVEGGTTDATDCQLAIAFAEIVAAGNGRPGPNLPKEASVVLHNTDLRFSQDEIDLARKAVVAIATASELKELWDESPRSDGWRSMLLELQGRLSGNTISNS